MKKMKTLAIETSCDDTSVGIITLENNIYTVEKLLAYSQIDDHQKYGGVVPEIASRLHSEKLIKVLENIWRDEINKVDFISVTTHPGLPGSLVVGKAAAKLISSHFNKPLVEVNHIQWHIFSLLLERSSKDIHFPMVVLTASGGHNDLYLVDAPLSEGEGRGVRKIWQTIDDAAGECFDKIARMLWWPYPGWQRISEQAKKWTPGKIKLPRIWLSADEFNFSFSWMKGYMSNYLKKKSALTDQEIADICYDFQEALIEVMATKLIKAGKQYQAKTIAIAWWVSCNERLREYLVEQSNKKSRETICLRPTKKIYSTDNAAMIGVAGILKYKK